MSIHDVYQADEDRARSTPSRADRCSWCDGQGARFDLTLPPYPVHCEDCDGTGRAQSTPSPEEADRG